MKKLIIANWKMNPDTPREARALFGKIKRTAGQLRRSTVIVCPPALFLPLLKPGRNLALGGQDLFDEPRGAFTGSISAAQLKYSGAKYVIVGHSERRARGEDDKLVNRKIRLALKSGLQVIFCLGETKRDGEGDYLVELRSMLEGGLARVARTDLHKLMIAYEPVWAIGPTAGGTADSPEGFLEQSIFIRKVLAEHFGQARAMAIPILYGGSVTPANASGFLERGEAAGLLVGRESLRADRFAAILHLADKRKD